MMHYTEVELDEIFVSDIFNENGLARIFWYQGLCLRVIDHFH